MASGGGEATPRSTGWLAGWLAGWLVGWQAGWQAGELTRLSFDSFFTICFWRNFLSPLPREPSTIAVAAATASTVSLNWLNALSLILRGGA